MTTMTKNKTVRGTKQSMAGTMKAVVIRGFGGPDVLEPTEVPVVEPQPGHLLIKVNAAGLNRWITPSDRARSPLSFRGHTSWAPTPQAK